MDAYPQEYVEHNLPLILVSGLGEQRVETPNAAGLPRQENGTRLQASSPEIGGERAQSLLAQILQIDGSDQSWNASALPCSSGRLKYKIKAIGRTYTLPPRKAAPLAQATSLEGGQNGNGGTQKGTELHSPLSPLSPGSPVYPDGVFTPLWLAKHQQQVPALFITFFNISAGNNSQDEHIKADINSIRTSITRSGFKTKVVAVLISDKSILQAPDLDDRLTSIRRSTSLDSKTGLFSIPPMSPIEIATFVQGMLTTLQPVCIDHYRDLTKHARRKKSRVTSAAVPSSPIATTSQPLPASGWNVRYEVKQGIFAEFRQEMETAERHYSSAIDELFGTDGILELYTASSQRWMEARTLCDSLALRTLRCQLWTSSTSAAAQSWVNYKFRVADLISRRGKGLQTSDWHAWDARWAEIMAHLIVRAKIPALIPSEKTQQESAELTGQQLYALPEKAAAAAERLPPFQHLHHAGYWYKSAIRESRAMQRRRTIEISEGGEVPSSDSEASNQDGPGELKRLTAAAGEEFQSRSQVRMTELVKLDLAHDFADAGRYGDALNILMPLWDGTTWRDDGWEDLLTVLLLLLRRCAQQQEMPEVVVGATYELLSSRSTLSNDLTLDLGSCLNSMKEVPSGAIVLKIKDQQRLCPVAVSFAFESKQTHVGEPLGCQLMLESNANPDSSLLTFSSATLSFGTSRTFKIVHDSTSETIAREYVDLSEQTSKSGDSSNAKASLAMRSGERRTFRFTLTFREAEAIVLTQATLSIDAEKLNIEHSFTDPDLLASTVVEIETNGQIERKHLRTTESTAVSVLPKPPKVQISLRGSRKEYYTGEVVALGVDVTNAELEPVSGNIRVEVNGENDGGLSMRWSESQESNDQDENPQSTFDTLIAKNLPSMDPGASHKMSLLLTAPPDPLKTTVDISVEYKLPKDSTTPLRKNLTIDLNFIAPFEPKFNFGPQLYPDPWPSYFDRNGGTTTEKPGGVPQLWRLNSQLRCMAMGRIVLRDVEVVMGGVSGDSNAQATSQRPTEDRNLQNGQIARYSFEIHTQKHSLDDRRPTVVESTLEVTWSRENDDSLVTTKIPIPRLTLPVSEPRVLCTLAKTVPEDCDAVLQYHIENPSNHFLTFALSMDASEEFSFSGPKSRALSLAPLSRYKVEYRIIVPDEAVGANEDGRWIWPALQVVDSFYQKTLRVHPGGADVKIDEKQNIGVWI